MGCFGSEGVVVSVEEEEGFVEMELAEGMWYFVVMRVCEGKISEGHHHGGYILNEQRSGVCMERCRDQAGREHTLFGRACNSRADWRCHSSLDVKYGIVDC